MGRRFMRYTELFESRFTVKKEWVDYNGHMNMGFYLVALDHMATDAFFNALDIGVDYVEREAKSLFTLATNLDYVQEVFEGDPIRVTTQVLDYDAKRLHYIHCMYHGEEGFLSATNECLSMHVDMTTRKSAPFSDALQARFKEMLDAHTKLGVPEQAFRKLGIRR